MTQVPDSYVPPPLPPTQPTAPPPKRSPAWALPASILLAGLFVGTGLYLGLAASGSTSVAADSSLATHMASDEPSNTADTTQTPAPTATTPAPSTPAPTQPTSDEKRSARGALVGELNTPYRISDGMGGPGAQLNVTSVAPVGQCSREYAQDPENGMFLRVEFTVAVDPGYDGKLAANAHSWIVYSPDGQRANDSTGTGYSCLADGEEITSYVGAGENASGAVVLDVPFEHGVVAFGEYGTPLVEFGY